MNILPENHSKKDCLDPASGIFCAKHEEENSTPSPIGWEVKFDEEFATDEDGIAITMGNISCSPKSLKFFIRQTLSTEEARIRTDEADKCEEHTKEALELAHESWIEEGKAQERMKVVKMLESLKASEESVGVVPRDYAVGSEQRAFGRNSALTDAITRIQEGK